MQANRHFVVMFLVFLWTWLAAYQLSAQDRVALLVGNSDYGDQKLSHTKDDLRTLAEALRAGGFQVTVKQNVDKSFRQDLEAYARTCPDGGVSLFYYAGFGNRFQRKVASKVTRSDGTEEMVESLVWDTGIQPVDKPARESISLREIAQVFSRDSTARLHLLVFDCGLGNPDLPLEEQGLGTIDADQFPNALVCSATQPGTVLPKDHKSRMAASLARQILTKDREIGQVMAAVKDEIAQQSGGKQELWYDFSLPIDATVAVVSSHKRTIQTSKLPPQNPKPGEEWINGLGMVFCWVPPGSFRMGIADPQLDQAEDARPVDVTISEGFWIGKYEMACGTYRRLGKGPKGMPLVEHSNVPLTNINGPGALDMGQAIQRAISRSMH